MGRGAAAGGNSEAAVTATPEALGGRGLPLSHPPFNFRNMRREMEGATSFWARRSSFEPSKQQLADPWSLSMRY